MRNAIDELKLDIKTTNLKEYMTEITTVLQQANDRYMKMVTEMISMCSYNIEVYGMYQRVASDSGDFKWEIHMRVKYLGKMIDRTLKDAAKANNMIDEIHKSITAVSGKLVYVQESFKQIADAKLEQLENDITHQEQIEQTAVKKFLFYTFGEDTGARRGCDCQEQID